MDYSMVLINELKKTKDDIKQAILDKGGSVNGGMTTYGDSIRELTTTRYNYKVPLKYSFHQSRECLDYDWSNYTDDDYILDRCPSPSFCKHIAMHGLQNLTELIGPATSELGNGVVEKVSLKDTYNIKKMLRCYSGWITLTHVDEIECDSVTYFVGVLSNCYDSIKYLGGFKNLGKQPELILYDSEYSTNRYPLMNTYLNRDNLLNVLNGLYDRASAGYGIVNFQMESSNIRQLTDEDIAIATNKGWTISS